ncbi:MAG: HAMP domain-containing protein [Betaproteobacteria bacterium]|nr:HAMP domain-containing protein [Betaproteobacteria bacterium]
MKRLYVQIFLTVVAALLAFALLAGIAWRLFGEPRWTANAREAVSELIQAALPPADAPPRVHQAALDRIAGRLHHDIGLYGADGVPLAHLGRALPAPDFVHGDSGWLSGRGPPAWSLQLPDGRWLVARFHRGPRAPVVGLVATLALLALGVAVGVYPVVRRLTRRLERLKAGVDALGSGDLATRVPVEGRDEVAALAETFNRSAGRIEALVAAHKKLLANASHELRSPLARIRMAVGMQAESVDPKLRAEVERDIAELDALIDEILLSSRLDALEEGAVAEEVDLLALAAEECARIGGEVQGDPVILRGESRLLRRLLRNLIENARRHGAGSPIDVVLRRPSTGRVEVRVCDRGPGVPEAERERIFEPFYRMPGASEREGGVGLGLALARQIARRHRGDVRCEAREGGGSCFVVDLPVGEVSAANS